MVTEHAEAWGVCAKPPLMAESAHSCPHILVVPALIRNEIIKR